jgi:hypothetical protein
MVGGAPIFFSSKKQKCLSKSPTEEELVVLSDNIGVVELLQELLAFMVDTALPDPVVFQDQDNTLVITLVTQVRCIPCTKHMRARMNLVCEVVEEQEMVIKYVGIKEMKADGLTKVLRGAEFKEFVMAVLGRTFLNKSTGEHWVGIAWGARCKKAQSWKIES